MENKEYVHKVATLVWRNVCNTIVGESIGLYYVLLNGNVVCLGDVADFDECLGDDYKVCGITQVRGQSCIIVKTKSNE
jgi:hypothetical protein